MAAINNMGIPIYTPLRILDILLEYGCVLGTSYASYKTITYKLKKKYPQPVHKWQNTTKIMPFFTTWPPVLKLPI